MLEHWRATIWNQRICSSAKLSPTFGSCCSARIVALSMSILWQCCLLGFGGYLQYDANPRSFLGRTELPPAVKDRRHEARRLCPGLWGRSYACHRVDHPSCPHLCRGGRRQLHSSTAFAVTARHFSRFSFARSRRLRRCADMSAINWRGKGWSRCIHPRGPSITACLCSPVRPAQAPDQRVVKVLQPPKSQNKLCGVWILFKSVTDAKFEPSEVSFLRLIPSTTYQYVQYIPYVHSLQIHLTHINTDHHTQYKPICMNTYYTCLYTVIHICTFQYRQIPINTYNTYSMYNTYKYILIPINTDHYIKYLSIQAKHANTQQSQLYITMQTNTYQNVQYIPYVQYIPQHGPDSFTKTNEKWRFI